MLSVMQNADSALLDTSLTKKYTKKLQHFHTLVHYWINITEMYYYQILF